MSKAYFFLFCCLSCCLLPPLAFPFGSVQVVASYCIEKLWTITLCILWLNNDIKMQEVTYLRLRFFKFSRKRGGGGLQEEGILRLIYLLDSPHQYSMNLFLCLQWLEHLAPHFQFYVRIPASPPCGSYLSPRSFFLL